MNVAGFLFVAGMVVANLATLVFVVLSLARCLEPSSRPRALVGLGVGILGGLVALFGRLVFDLAMGNPVNSSDNGWLALPFMAIGFAPAFVTAEIVSWLRSKNQRRANGDG